MSVWGIPSHDVAQVAERLRPFLESFADRSSSRWTVAGIMAEASAQEVQVWVCGDWQAVCLTRVWPDAVSIVACAGSDRGDWQEALEKTIREWARWLGKRQLLIDGRPGWSRWLKSIGYQEAHREMVVDLNG